ncbi:zinc finger, C2H2 type [Ancylostoma caninum]|uniref:Zinc finger, C2H2 type n=1 Tax=Ancylostoma caninum TaxID=29170 RepID=A0A368H522_ANCCA|nr:zinc finger, C2H2 type [Ancylostoma caninum]
MLSMGSASRSVLQAPGLPCPLRNVIVSRCDGNIPSSSDASSSSCSPSSTENMHQQQSLKSSESTIDSAVASILNHALKPEPCDGEFSADSNGSSAHRMPMQPMPLHIGAGYGGRCSENSATSGAMSNTSGSSTPAPVRRSRSSHDGMLKCQFCPKKWADQNALHTHMADCRLARGHECSQCGKRFKARGGLQQHLRIHSNDRPYACHFCAKRFTQKSHVDQHERIHTGIYFGVDSCTRAIGEFPGFPGSKPFSCQFCGRAFRQRSQQLGHEATHSNLLSTTGQVVATQPQNQHQPLPGTASQPQSQHNHQPQQELLRNELQPSNGLLHDLQTSTLPSSNQLSLLALGQAASNNPSSSCTNSAVSSLLALSQNQSNPAPSHPHFPTSNHLHQAAVGLLNSLQ